MNDKSNAVQQNQGTEIEFPLVNDNSSLLSFIDKVKDRMIPLVPEMYNFVKPELKIGFQRVSVNVDNDAYPVDGGKYSLHLQKLKEIAEAAGLKIVDSIVLARETGNDGRVTYIKHQVKWEKRSIDGSEKSGTVTGEYSYEEDKARFIYKADEVKNGKLIAKAGEPKWTQINKRRSFAGSLAESNAVFRAINSGIAKLPQSFSKEDFKRPFLVPCVIEDFSSLLKNHPELEKAYLAQKMGLQLSSSNTLSEITTPINTNVTPPNAETEKPVDNKKDDVEEAKYVEEKENQQPAADNVPEEVKPKEEKKFTQKELNHFKAEDYREQEQSVRTKVIEDLVAKKKYRRANPKTPIETYSVDKQIELIELLLNLPDPK